MILLDTRTYAEQVAAENGVHNADAGVTIYVGMQGAKAPVALQAFAKLRLTRLDRAGAAASMRCLSISGIRKHRGTRTPSQSTRLPAAEWLALGDFKPQLVEQVAQGAEFDVTSNELDRKSAHLDLYFPGRLARELEIAVRHLDVGVIGPAVPPPDLSLADILALGSFLSNLPASSDPAKPNDGHRPWPSRAEICAQVRPVGFQDRDAGDNEICTPLTLVSAAAATTAVRLSGAAAPQLRQEHESHPFQQGLQEPLGRPELLGGRGLRRVRHGGQPWLDRRAERRRPGHGLRGRDSIRAGECQGPGPSRVCGRAVRSEPGRAHGSSHPGCGRAVV